MVRPLQGPGTNDGGIGEDIRGPDNSDDCDVEEDNDIAVRYSIRSMPTVI